jgi:bifunctional polynucleotide phosphatase/kinase
MAFEEKINENGKILFWQPEIKYRTNSSLILGMDLDWTIIKPLTGKVHPKNKDDWTFWAESLEKIKEKCDAGYKFVIFTNQGGLLKEKSNRLNLEDFKERWFKIYEKFKENGITSVYLVAALYDDFYRKPCTGMWEFVEKHLNGNGSATHIVDRKKSIYIGDMAGRDKDYAATDLLFAMNLGVPFQVPELFYYPDKYYKNKILENEYKQFDSEYLISKIKKNDKQFKPIDFLQNIKYEKTNGSVDINKDSNKDNIYSIKRILDRNTKCLILFVGSPASGKTFFYNKYFKNNEKIIYMSKDTFNGTDAKFNKEVEKNLSNESNNTVLIDNTNGKLKNREKLLKIAKEQKARTIIIKFDISKQLVMHLNELRTKLSIICELNEKKSCKKSVPTVAINTFWKYFEEPDKDEGIDYIFHIEYKPDFTNTEGGISKERFNLLL